ncbi:MAG: hypothetical protein SFW36_23485 [Leptolyngbyaceae cyanobacterium bins.59]|nr:hypothetical protein [Leptolyngbyaceae cyanobacterium bins.59]
MTASDEFKKELRRDDLDTEGIRGALKMALSEAIELKITTWVVSPDDVGSEQAEPKPGYRMQTRINIVDGDIDNEVGSQFLTNGPYTELRDFHLDQVQDGRDIIQQNLINLQHLFGVLGSTMKRISYRDHHRLESPTPPSPYIGP